MDRDGITVSCKNVSITAGDQLKILGKDVNIIGTSTAHLTGGGEVLVTGGGKATLDGGMVLINGPGPFAARVGDAAGGTILSGSSTVVIGGSPAPPQGQAAPP